MRQNWPERLWLVRHGQSQGVGPVGFLAREIAHEIPALLNCNRSS